jgi:peptide chain release factor 1
METIFVEIRAAEGGMDAKLLVREQFTIYVKWATRKGLTIDILEDRPGIMVVRITGPGAKDAFKQEGGGHRWQRVPPTEKGGRKHTSTITVAVLPGPTGVNVNLQDSDLDWKATKGSGAGGQKRNKTSSAIQMTHLPSGIAVRVESERSQHRNLLMAKELIAARLAERAVGAVAGARNARRRTQVGTGMRGDKVRTVALQRGQVVDHVTGRRVSAEKYLRGELEKLVG